MISHEAEPPLPRWWVLSFGQDSICLLALRDFHRIVLNIPVVRMQRGAKTNSCSHELSSVLLLTWQASKPWFQNQRFYHVIKSQDKLGLTKPSFKGQNLICEPQAGEAKWRSSRSRTRTHNSCCDSDLRQWGQSGSTGRIPVTGHFKWEFLL